MIFFEAFGQEIPQPNDFMFPVRPRQENYLAGTMGELRSSHFHSGLDIKTSGITGLPIYAAADGYIQRVRVALGGYGNALYLVHPENGTVTVYAHLKSFHDDIASYVRAKQYEEESFEIDLYPDKNQFAFKKGDVIALSGNSGSSSGPHLHFEIRNLSHKALDPLEFGFDEIVDDIPPVLAAISFVTMDENSRVNGMWGRFEFDIKEDENGYPYIKEGVSLFGNIGVEIYAYDKFNGARNRNGIRFQTLTMDGKLLFKQRIEQLNFSNQRNILVHTNYKRYREGGRKFNKLYVDQGNGLKFYETNENRGLLRIYDPLEHQIDIRLEDAYGNINQVNIPINKNGFERDRESKHTYRLDADGYDILNHWLEIESEEGYCDANFFINGRQEKVDMAYYTNSSHHFLWDLRKGIPDSAELCNQVYYFDIKSSIPSEQMIKWESEDIRISFPKYALFDTTYIQYKKENRLNGLEVFNLNNPTTPLRQFVTVYLKPQGIYDLVKSGVYAVEGKDKLSYVGGEWEGEELVFKTRDLVSFTIATDSIPPEIKKIKAIQGRLTLKISDKMSGVHSIRATLNGNWVLMNYDAKSGYVWSDEEEILKGQFSFSVKDNANNISRYEETF